jgi:predicted site-specific integrase-resolvase
MWTALVVHQTFAIERLTRDKLSVIEALQGQGVTDSGDAEIPVTAYCRASSHDQKQKGDLERQFGRVTTHCVSQGYKMVAVLEELVEDILSLMASFSARTLRDGKRSAENRKKAKEAAVGEAAK